MDSLEYWFRRHMREDAQTIGAVIPELEAIAAELDECCGNIGEDVCIKSLRAIAAELKQAKRFVQYMGE
jgi:hypothetical protein